MLKTELAVMTTELVGREIVSLIRSDREIDSQSKY